MLVFHYFNEVDTPKRTILEKLVSCFKELDTNEGTMLRDPGFIF